MITFDGCARWGRFRWWAFDQFGLSVVDGWTMVIDFRQCWSVGINFDQCWLKLYSKHRLVVIYHLMCTNWSPPHHLSALAVSSICLRLWVSDANAVVFQTSHVRNVSIVISHPRPPNRNRIENAVRQKQESSPEQAISWISRGRAETRRHMDSIKVVPISRSDQIDVYICEHLRRCFSHLVSVFFCTTDA